MQGQGKFNSSSFNRRTLNGICSNGSTFNASTSNASTSNAFPGHFSLSYDPNGINFYIDQVNMIAANASVYNFNPAPHAGAGTDQRLSGQHPEPNVAPFQHNFLNKSQFVNGPSGSQGTSSRALPSGIDANEDMDQRLSGQHPEPNVAPFQHNLLNKSQFVNGPSGSQETSSRALPSGIDANEDMHQRLSGQHPEPNVAPFQHNFLNKSQFVNGPSGSQGTSSRALPSGIDANEDMDVDLKLGLPFRQDIENAPSPASSSNLDPIVISSGIAEYVVEERYGSDGRRMFIKRRAPEGAFGQQVYQGESSRSAELDGNSQQQANWRNVHTRTAHQQHFVPANLSSWTNRYPHVQSSGQPGTSFPFHHLPSTLAEATVHPNPPMQPLVCFPTSSQGLQPFQQTHVPANVNLANRMNVSGNVASSSQNGSSSHVCQPESSNRLPQENRGEQHSQSQTKSCAQGSSCQVHLSASAGVRGGSARHSQLQPRSGLVIGTDRQAGGQSQLVSRSTTAPRSGLTNRTVAQASGQSQSASQSSAAYRNTFMAEEAVAANNADMASVPECEHESPDPHEDMRLDIDDMTYEGLLGLQEQMGYVSTGLSEDAVLARIKLQKYCPRAGGPRTEGDNCCICQEEYDKGGDVGKLDCQHGFHFDCIKQWLVLKNSCPICKMKGLSN